MKLTTFLLFLAAAAIERPAGESPAVFAKRLTPANRELAHVPLEGAFGPGAGNVVLLWRKADAVDTNYTGEVLVPAASAGSSRSYLRYSLPPMQEIPGHFEIDVAAVFYANADRDAPLELIVLPQPQGSAIHLSLMALTKAVSRIVSQGLSVS
ncbi:MAG: hypothetical protein FJW31_04705 [Acidobacteria bacterium]|nr:hypothetical protein [Acidobacteriota bacterium]